MAFERILCAVDFADGSREALRVAAELARTSQAVLVLLHVFEPPLWVSRPGLRFPGDLPVHELERIDTELVAWADDARRRGAVNVVTARAGGVAWEEIVGYARCAPAIDLIVVGTHGRRGVARALVGSVAEHVVRHAPCPVLVVREQASS